MTLTKDYFKAIAYLTIQINDSLTLVLNTICKIIATKTAKTTKTHLKPLRLKKITSMLSHTKVPYILWIIQTNESLWFV